MMVIFQHCFNQTPANSKINFQPSHEIPLHVDCMDQQMDQISIDIKVFKFKNYSFTLKSRPQQDQNISTSDLSLKIRLSSIANLTLKFNQV